MVRLTREVRFGIDLHRQKPVDGGNGYAGRPTLTGLGHFLALRVCVEGEPDPASGYLLNIKEIDTLVRERIVPLIERAVRDQEPREQPLLLCTIAEMLAQSWLPVRLASLELCLSPYLSFAWNALEPAMIRLSQKFEFSAAHRLHNSELSTEENVATFGKCNNPHGHGHNYEVQVTIAGTPDGESGQILAVDQLERIVEEQVIEPFDHKHLNLEVPEFKKLNPSVENIARVIYRRLAPTLSQTGTKLTGVTVWETPKTWAEYTEASAASKAE